MRTRRVFYSSSAGPRGGSESAVLELCMSKPGVSYPVCAVYEIVLLADCSGFVRPRSDC